MSLDLEIADAMQRQVRINSPDSFATVPEENAVDPENAVTMNREQDGLMAAGDESVDEDAIKESPPRSSSKRLAYTHARQSSEPRPFGEVIDEAEVERKGAGSPSLRHVRGRLEEKGSWEKEGFDDAVREHAPVEGRGVVNGNGDGVGDGGVAQPIPHRIHPTLAGNMMDPSVQADGQMKEGGGVGGMLEERVREEGLEHISEQGTLQSSEGNASAAPNGLGVMTNGNGNGNGNGVAAKHAIQGTRTPETYEAVGEDESPRSPVRKARKRVSSRSLNGSAKKQMLQQPQDGQPRSLSLQQQEGVQGTSRDAQQDEIQLSPKSKAPDFLSLDGSSDDQQAQQTQQAQHLQQPQPTQQSETGQLVYENHRNKSGENLASIRPADDYISTLRLSQREDKDRPPTLPSRPSSSRHNRSSSELVSGRRAGAGWSRSAIRWSPLNVPLQRRMQTFMVLLHTLSIAGGLALFFLLCTIPLLWPILLPYLLYVLLSRTSVDGRLSQRSDWLRRSKIWSLFAGYFPARLHRTQPLEPTRKYIFGYHPHGIISHGAFAAFGTEALGFSQLFPGITNTLLTLDANFRIPLYRDYALRMGLASVSRESCENILSHGGANGEGMGRAITIVVGGARESLDAKPGTLQLVLKRRKGFVKLAVRTGADLVPVLSFGENDIYEQVDARSHPYMHRGQMAVKRVFGFTVPLFHARGVFNYDVGLMPYRRPINIVVGRPIRIQQSKTPDPAYVDEMHRLYVTELERLWEEWKDTFARGREGELEVVD